MIEEYNLSEKLRAKGVLKTLSHQQAIERRKKQSESKDAFKEGYTDEYVF